jgi:hypothetical protein
MHHLYLLKTTPGGHNLQQQQQQQPGTWSAQQLAQCIMQARPVLMINQHTPMQVCAVLSSVAATGLHRSAATPRPTPKAWMPPSQTYLGHCRSYRQDGCLRWVDDCCKLLDAKHAQVADGESATHELMGLQLVLLGLNSTARGGRRQPSAQNSSTGWQGGNHQHSTVQYSTVQYSTVQYSTVQYSTGWQEAAISNIDCRKNCVSRELLILSSC